MLISKYRDLTIIDLDKEKLLTVACDSCGGIGEGNLDVVKAAYDIVGYFTARVCLFETVSFGAVPVVVVNNLCVERAPRGEKLMTGVNRAINEYNYSRMSSKILENGLTGSTEENFKTLQTAIGITVIGEKDKFSMECNVEKGDVVISIGLPKVGQEVIDDIILNKCEIVSFKTMAILKTNIKSLDVLPVGSKGILYEISELEKTNNIKIKLYDNLTININKSSGPATVVLAIIKASQISIARELIKEPINILGEVI